MDVFWLKNKGKITPSKVRPKVILIAEDNSIVRPSSSEFAFWHVMTAMNAEYISRVGLINL